jgi:protein-S-isoprenylcysteine O-methyltransferase Ste14
LGGVKGDIFMGWFSVLISGAATVLMYKKMHIFLTILAFITLVVCFWSWGVMHNFATESAKKRRNYKGGFYDFTEKDIEAVPNWITWINMGFSLLGLGILITGILSK